jgi:uncharacterized protein YwqG
MSAGCAQDSQPPPAVAAWSCPEREKGFPAELQSLRGAYDKSALPYAAISASPGATTRRQSKFLGQPYWPAELPFPRDVDGQPLKLLAQVNFAEAPSLEDYPRSGILQFYVAPTISENQIWGMRLPSEPYSAAQHLAGLNSQDYFRVVYHEEVNDLDAGLLVIAPEPDGDMSLPISNEGPMSFRPAVGHVLNEDVRFSSVFGAPSHEFFGRFGPKACEVGSAYFKNAYTYSLAQIGGYAAPVQSDPRGLAAEADWVVLLQIESSQNADEVEILWGDAGVGFFFIRRTDLVERNFSRVMYAWDNH